jgi:glycosyltransferase involved in cell wall biosynthesis
VLPSLREGFGRPLLEAMYCDKPIIASRIPTSVEIAGSCGHFFGLGDADEFYQCVRDALGDTRRAERAAAAREALARYSWKNLSAVYSNIYRMAVCRS